MTDFENKMQIWDVSVVCVLFLAGFFLGKFFMSKYDT